MPPSATTMANDEVSKGCWQWGKYGHAIITETQIVYHHSRGIIKIFTDATNSPKFILPNNIFVVDSPKLQLTNVALHMVLKMPTIKIILLHVSIVLHKAITVFWSSINYTCYDAC